MYRKVFYTIIMAVLLIVICTSCGVNGKYEKLTNSAEEAISQWNFEEAAGYYEDIIALDSNSLDNGESKINSAEISLENIEEILENIDSIKKEYDDVIEAAENLKLEETNIDSIKEIYYKILDMQEKFYGLSNTNPAKKLKELQEKIESDIKNQIIQDALIEFEASLNDIKFDNAENKLKELRKVKKHFPNLISTDLIELDEKLRNEKAKYIETPIDIMKRDSLLYEDINGKITFLGEGKRKNALYAFYKFEGSIKDIAKKVNLKANVTLTDGTHEDNSPDEFRYYDDYTIGIGYLSDNLENTIEKFAYIHPFDSNKMNEFNYNDSKMEMIKLPEVYKYPTKELETEILLEDDETKVEINKLIIDNSKMFMNKITVTVEGVFTPKEEIDRYRFDSNCYLYNPMTRDSAVSSFTNYSITDFTKNFEHDFSVSFKIPEIQKDTKYLTLYFKDLRTNIDLTTGKQYVLDKETMDKFLIESDSLFADVNTNLDDNGMYFKSKSGDFVINTIELNGGTGFMATSIPEMKIMLGQMYSILTVDIGVDETTADKNYSNTVVSFISDGNSIKEVKIPQSLETISVEVPIDGVKTLNIKADHNSRDEQKILLQNGILNK